MNIFNKKTIIITLLLVITIILFADLRIKANEIKELTALIDKQSGIAQDLNMKAKELADLAQKSAAEAQRSEAETIAALEMAEEMRAKLIACESK